jgi:hypothetical protein
MKSNLKKHCVAGPKSPSRCMSAKLAAIPPAFFHFPTGKTFHLALSESELANPSLRFSLGKLAHDIDTNANTIESSFDEVTLQLENTNESTKQCLRKFRDDILYRRRNSSQCTTQTSGAKEVISGGLCNVNYTPSKTRTRRIRRGTSKISHAAVVKSHDESKVCENTGTNNVSETKSSTMVQSRSKSRNVRHIRKTTTTNKETTRRHSESKHADN